MKSTVRDVDESSQGVDPASMRLLLPGAGHSVLTVDGDGEAREAIAVALERVGFSVLRVRTGKEALERAAIARPDVVTLEVALTDMSGFDVCRGLRQRSEAGEPVIVFVTAAAGEIDRVVAFELGADDYVTKPFSARELSLRVLARLRARRELRGPNERRTRFGVLEIDVPARRVYVASREVYLTPIEFSLLAALVSEPNRARSRVELMRAAVDRPVTGTARAVDTHVKRLRRKIGPAGEYIRTLRGVGYRFAASPADIAPKHPAHSKGAKGTGRG